MGNQTGLTITKKLSMRSVTGSKKEMLALAESGKGKPVLAARFMGMATGIKTGEGDNGPWLALTGEHKGINAATGEEVRSPVCFMPSPAGELVAAQLAQEGVNTVNYAFDVLVIEDETSAVGYVYETKTLMEVSEADPLNALEASLSAAPLALAAPEKDAKGKK